MKKKVADFDENSINIFYYQIPDNLSNKNRHALISLLPVYEQNHILSIQNIESQQKSLFGRIMLRSMFSEFHIEELAFIETTKTGNPFLPFSPFIKFSISHSGKMVICALTEDSSVGVDIEYTRNIKLDIYEQYFSSREWKFIQTSNNPQLSFFYLWTRKEAVIKADGRGMKISLSSLNCLNSTVNTDLNKWQIQNLKIAENYVCAIACENDKTIKQFNFNELFTIETGLNVNAPKTASL